MVVHDTYIASHGIKAKPLLKYIHYGEEILFYIHLIHSSHREAVKDELSCLARVGNVCHSRLSS
jgi:hypothetical protein